MDQINGSKAKTYDMETKKLIGTILTVLGIICLIAGVFGIFSGGQALGMNAYAFGY